MVPSKLFSILHTNIVEDTFFIFFFLTQHNHISFPMALRSIIFLSYAAVVLNRGGFCPLGGIWQCLETFLVVTIGRSGERCYWLLNILQSTGQLPHQRIIWLIMLMVLRLRTLLSRSPSCRSTRFSLPSPFLLEVELFLVFH